MIIPKAKRPWIKNTSQGAVYTDGSFYRTPAWRALRARKLALNPFCECEDCEGKKVKADMVHHLKAISDGGDPLDINNLKSLRNHPCHDKTRANEKNDKYRKISK